MNKLGKKLSISSIFLGISGYLMSCFSLAPRFVAHQKQMAILGVVLMSLAILCCFMSMMISKVKQRKKMRNPNE